MIDVNNIDACQTTFGAPAERDKVTGQIWDLKIFYELAVEAESW